VFTIITTLQQFMTFLYAVERENKTFKAAVKDVCRFIVTKEMSAFPVREANFAPIDKSGTSAP
jgi:hypothetical protein